MLVRMKVAYSSTSHLRRWGTLVSKPIFTFQWRQRFYKEGEGQKSEETKGRGLKVLYVPMSIVHSNKDLRTGQAMV